MAVSMKPDAVEHVTYTGRLIEVERLRSALDGALGRYRGLLAERVQWQRSRATQTAPLTLTGYQINALHDFTDGEADTEITVQYLDERPPDADGNAMPAGLWAWFTEYPDEGAMWLAKDADEYLASMPEGDIP